MKDLVKIADRVRGGVTLTATMLLLYVLFVSRDHVTHIAYFIGLDGYQAETLFVLIDLPAVVGRVLQLHFFAASTRRVGRRLTYFSGSLSLACNVGSGFLTGGLGVAGYGAFIVVMFLVLEGVVTKIKPAGSVTKARNAASGTTNRAPKAPAEVLTPRQIGARKGVETKRRNAAMPVSPGAVPVERLNVDMALSER